MLAFSGQSAFETWLQSCPLGDKAMTYRLERRGGGSDVALTVSVQWEVAPLQQAGAEPLQQAGTAPLQQSGAAASALASLQQAGHITLPSSPQHEAGARMEALQRAAEDDTKAEIADTKARLAAMQAAIAAASKGPFASELMRRMEQQQQGEASVPSATAGTDGGGAAVAAAMIKRMSGATGPPDTSAEAVRATLAQLGVTLPKPPGSGGGGSEAGSAASPGTPSTIRAPAAAATPSE